MANIQGQKKWSEVRLLETHELARGGVNGNLNEQAQSLLNCIEFLKQRIISVIDFGAKGDGINDDTIPIRNAIADAKENNGVVWFPSATSEYQDGIVPSRGYLTTDQIVFPSKLHVKMDSPIVYDGPSTAPALVYGTALPLNKSQFSEFVNVDVWVINKKKAPWGVSTSVGAWLYPHQFCTINLKNVLGFDTGVILNADKQGFVYNNINVGEIRGNRVGKHWLVTNKGWFNENTLIKGRISSTPTPLGHEETNRYGVIGTTDFYNIQNNHWLNPCFELGANTNDESIPISLSNASGNTFNNIRAEGHKKWIARFTDGSSNNIITSDYGRIDDSVPANNKGVDFRAIDDQTTYKTNMFMNSGYELLFRSFSKFTLNSFSKDFYYHNGSFGAVAGFANVSSSPVYPAVPAYTQSAYANVVDSSGAMRFGSATVRSALRVKLNGAKRIVLKQFGSNIIAPVVRCFDSALNLLYDTNIKYAHELNVQGGGGYGSTSYGGCYALNNPCGGVTVIGFLDGVEYIDILLGGSTDAAINAIEVSTPDLCVISHVPFFPNKTAAIKPTLTGNVQEGTVVYNDGYNGKGIFSWVLKGTKWHAVNAAGIITSKTYDPLSLAAGATQLTTMPLTGAAVGDTVACSFSLPLGGTRIWAEVTTENMVTVYHNNPTASTIDIASGTLFVKLI